MLFGRGRRSMWAKVCEHFAGETGSRSVIVSYCAMNKTWQLRLLAIYLAAGAPLAASCAREANTLEDDPSGTGGKSTASAGNAGKSGGTSKSGSANVFGGTGNMAAAGESAAEGGEPAAAGGDGTGGSAGSSGGGGKAGGGGTGGVVGVPPDVLANAAVVLHYQTDKTTADTPTIFMKMFIENKSDDPLPMASVKVRYWFTSEAAAPVLKHFFQGGNIAGQAEAFVLDAGNSHVLITFSGNSIAKGADLNASEFQLQIENGAQNQSNDYSWQPAYTSRMPHDKITVYLSDKLIWGCEPSGTCAGDAGAGGAGGTTGAGGAP